MLTLLREVLVSGLTLALAALGAARINVLWWGEVLDLRADVFVSRVFVDVERAPRRARHVAALWSRLLLVHRRHGVGSVVARSRGLRQARSPGAA